MREDVRVDGDFPRRPGGDCGFGLDHAGAASRHRDPAALAQCILGGGCALVAAVVVHELLLVRGGHGRMVPGRLHDPRCGVHPQAAEEARVRARHLEDPRTFLAEGLHFLGERRCDAALPGRALLLVLPCHVGPYHRPHAPGGQVYRRHRAREVLRRPPSQRRGRRLCRRRRSRHAERAHEHRLRVLLAGHGGGHRDDERRQPLEVAGLVQPRGHPQHRNERPSGSSPAEQHGDEVAPQQSGALLGYAHAEALPSAVHSRHYRAHPALPGRHPRHQAGAVQRAGKHGAAHRLDQGAVSGRVRGLSDPHGEPSRLGRQRLAAPLRLGHVHRPAVGDD
mmetsp:Transcript_118041/g.341265  ORF Transcript_118041/g.341265 Transcript_118041/m.341265 type:complete len:336 (+) Transcript_118041:932-1939(+)